MQVTQFCPGCNDISVNNLLFRKSGVPIYRCPNCGLGMAHPENFNPESYYDLSYFNGGKSDGYSNYVGAGEVLRRQFIQDIELLKKLGSTSGDLLELGCAYGYFLDVAKGNYNVIGLEICQEAVDDCQARGLKNVHQGTISAKALNLMPIVDVVVMLDVIEHLPDPMEGLTAAASKLRPNGLLLITTGDFSSMCAKITRQHWRLMTPPQHLWYFTPRSIEKMGASLGLDLVHLDHPFKNVPFGLIVYQLCRYLSLKPKLPSWMHRIGLPINLFDAMRVVFRKRNI